MRREEEKDDRRRVRQAVAPGGGGVAPVAAAVLQAVNLAYESLQDVSTTDVQMAVTRGVVPRPRGTVIIEKAPADLTGSPLCLLSLKGRQENYNAPLPTEQEVRARQPRRWQTLFDDLPELDESIPATTDEFLEDANGCVRLQKQLADRSYEELCRYLPVPALASALAAVCALRGPDDAPGALHDDDMRLQPCIVPQHEVEDFMKYAPLLEEALQARVARFLATVGIVYAYRVRDALGGGMTLLTPAYGAEGDARAWTPVTRMRVLRAILSLEAAASTPFEQLGRPRQTFPLQDFLEMTVAHAFATHIARAVAVTGHLKCDRFDLVTPLALVPDEDLDDAEAVGAWLYRLAVWCDLLALGSPSILRYIADPQAANALRFGVPDPTEQVLRDPQAPLSADFSRHRTHDRCGVCNYRTRPDGPVNSGMEFPVAIFNAAWRRIGDYVAESPTGGIAWRHARDGLCASVARFVYFTARCVNQCIRTLPRFPPTDQLLGLCLRDSAAALQYHSLAMKQRLPLPLGLVGIRTD